MYVFAQEIKIIEQQDQNVNHNEIQLDGFICKPPIYRLTPRGREIADVLIAVNRPYGKADYIPCVCWGVNAKLMEIFHIGERLKIKGRIQSRSYMKKLKDGLYENRTAYEISVRNMESI